MALTILRILAVVVAGVAVALSSLGFAAQASLNSGEQFAQDMSTALADPQVHAEIKQTVRDEAKAAIDRANAQGGVLGTIGSVIGSDTIADQASKVVDTDAFANAWDDWALLLHQGLADEAYGRPNSNVTVNGSTIVVGIGPLIEPVIGTGLTGKVTGALDLFDQSQTISIQTDTDLQRQLTAVGRLVELRWVLLAVGVAAGLIAWLVGRGRLLWLTITLAAMASGVGILTVVVSITQRSGGSTTLPATGRAVTAALTQGWTENLILVTIGLALAALVGVLALVLKGRRQFSADGMAPAATAP